MRKSLHVRLGILRRVLGSLPLGSGDHLAYAFWRHAGCCADVAQRLAFGLGQGDETHHRRIAGGVALGLLPDAGEQVFHAADDRSWRRVNPIDTVASTQLTASI